jgi:hypothetical protein
MFFSLVASDADGSVLALLLRDRFMEFVHPVAFKKYNSILVIFCVTALRLKGEDGRIDFRPIETTVLNN